jgi:hypothetical protein
MFRADEESGDAIMRRKRGLLIESSSQLAVSVIE